LIEKASPFVYSHHSKLTHPHFFCITVTSTNWHLWSFRTDSNNCLVLSASERKWQNYRLHCVHAKNIFGTRNRALPSTSYSCSYSTKSLAEVKHTLVLNLLNLCIYGRNKKVNVDETAEVHQFSKISVDLYITS